MIEQIAEGLYLVHGANRGRFPWSHSILAAGDRTVLFDTGCGEPAREWLHLVRDVLGHVPTAPTGTFREGDIIDTGPLRFRALHTPGHTADHFCFVEEEMGILLSFDIDPTPFGPWYGHDECDLDQFCASLHRIQELRPSMVVSSHRRPLSDGIEEEIAAFDAVFVRRNEKIVSMLEAGPALPEELAELSPFYGVPQNDFALARYFEARMIEKHLELLARRGLALRSKGVSYSLS
ncbi:MAG: hypothetical protein PHP28_01220 [Actinomycetota bacterium]|nr:hypothetical protein [Actinomycetota bacterium]MDD5667338.1 hypothetical protein [Actinomycetota bacterium]